LEVRAHCCLPRPSAHVWAFLRTLEMASPPPPCVAVLGTQWGSNPNFLGAYSSIAVGASPRDREVLAGHIGARLVFAGEATSIDGPATLHGAYQSGERAAAQVLDAAGATFEGRCVCVQVDRSRILASPQTRMIRRLHC
jgi:hypothetical protein